MVNITLDGDTITDWPSFHDTCKKAFGFPDFYGRNMDAWVDCLSDLRDEDGMTKFRLRPDETLTIEVLNSASLRRRLPAILDAMEDCIADLNEQYVEFGEAPALELVLR